MTWNFAESWDLYAVIADAVNGYWDSAVTIAGFTLAAGRFSGSQALHIGSVNINIVKSSAVNDAVHHLVLAFRQTGALSGTTAGAYLQLLDGATAQCSVVFRSDGVILLTSGGPTGTTLASYTGAVTAINTWYAFEFEIVINNTTGSFSVRKDGNPSNNFSATGLDTQNSANAYANKLQIGAGTTITACDLDDLFWRSDTSSVAWMGDIRCYTRMPASDSSVTFSRVPTSNTQTPFVNASTAGVLNGTARYTPFTAAYDGTIGTATVSFSAGYTGNLKCSIFASSGTAPTTVLGSATTLSNPATGNNTITFGTPVAVSKGTSYYIGFDSDTTSGTFNVGGALSGFTSTTAYASFPVASPTTTTAPGAFCSLTISVTTNNSCVNEAQEDGLTSYVYDSTVNDADFYTIGSIPSQPSSVIAVTTRGYMQKSDAGSRTAAVQLKSGGTTVATPTLTLTTSGWQWAWRTDVTDPNTGSAWGTSAVDSCLVGPKVIS